MGDDELRRRAERLKNKSKPRQRIEQGAVYSVADNVVALPSEGERKLHEKRRVIVIQSELANNTEAQPTVLVVPCSGSKMPGTFDLELQHPNGFTVDEPSVFVSLVQPVLKRDLVKREGKLSEDDFRKLRAMLVDSLIDGVQRL